MPFSSSAACRLALPAVSSRSAPDSVAPVTAGKIIFCFTEKRQEKSPRARACKNYFFKNGLIALIAAPVLALSFNILFILSLRAFVVLYCVAIYFISFISAALNCCGQFFKARSIVCGLSSFFVLFCFSTFVVVGEISSGSGSRLLRLF